MNTMNIIEMNYLRQVSTVQGLLSSQLTLANTQDPVVASQEAGVHGVEAGHVIKLKVQVPVVPLQASVVHKLLSLHTIGLE